MKFCETIELKSLLFKSQRDEKLVVFDTKNLLVWEIHQNKMKVDTFLHRHYNYNNTFYKPINNNSRMQIFNSLK